MKLLALFAVICVVVACVYAEENKAPPKGNRDGKKESVQNNKPNQNQKANGRNTVKNSQNKPSTGNNGNGNKPGNGDKNQGKKPGSPPTGVDGPKQSNPAKAQKSADVNLADLAL